MEGSHITQWRGRTWADLRQCLMVQGKQRRKLQETRASRLQFCVEEALAMGIKLLLVQKEYFLNCLANVEISTY